MNDNKLIAEFMELETSDGCYFKHLTKKGNIELTHHILLQYHTSWDWLMPVAEKIYSIDADVDFFKNISLEDTYKAVIEFIKNYE
jgi:hypothetical protein